MSPRSYQRPTPEPLPFGTAICPVRELIAYFLTGKKPDAVVPG
jgi:hypothetical protein